MGERVIQRCRRRKCRQSFGVIRLLEDNRAKCPFCGFFNKLNKKQYKKFLLI